MNPLGKWKTSLEMILIIYRKCHKILEFFHRFFRSLTFGLITAATQTKDQVLRNSILHSKVSRHIHEQGKTLFCWAFAISSMIRQSLITSLENFTSCDPQIINFALENLKQNAFHKKLRNELIMLPIPKINDQGSHYLERAVERVSFRVHKLYQVLIFYSVFSLFSNHRWLLKVFSCSMPSMKFLKWLVLNQLS